MGEVAPWALVAVSAASAIYQGVEANNARDEARANNERTAKENQERLDKVEADKDAKQKEMDEDAKRKDLTLRYKNYKIGANYDKMFAQSYDLKEQKRKDKYDKIYEYRSKDRV